MATIRHHARIDAAPDAVWNVVSDAGAISTWLMDGVLAEGLQGLKAHFDG